MRADEDGRDAATDRRAWRRSNWIQATCVFGFIGLVILGDWAVNGRLTYLGPVLLGSALGLALNAVRYVWRRWFRSTVTVPEGRCGRTRHRSAP